MGKNIRKKFFGGIHKKYGEEEDEGML